MKCPKCGNEIEDGKLYCGVCGEEIRIVPDFDATADIKTWEEWKNKFIENLARKLELC